MTTREVGRKESLGILVKRAPGRVCWTWGVLPATHSLNPAVEELKQPSKENQEQHSLAENSFPWSLKAKAQRKTVAVVGRWTEPGVGTLEIARRLFLHVASED